MSKRLMILLGCLSLVMLVACGNEEASTSEIEGNSAYEGEVEDVSLITSPDNGLEIEPEDEEGNPAYEGEVEDVSLITSPDNGSMIEAEEDMD